MSQKLRPRWLSADRTHTKWGKFRPYLMFAPLFLAIFNICFGLVGDSLEYGVWKTGVRQEGIVVSMLSFGAKISTALCGSVGVLLLAAVGYVAGAEQLEGTRKLLKRRKIGITEQLRGWRKHSISSSSFRLKNNDKDYWIQLQI